MSHRNFEFKARTNQLDALENKFKSLNPRFVGEDYQRDTYFNVSQGRLKLREGNIENSFIYYERSNSAEARVAQVILYPHTPNQQLKEILIKVHGVKVVVEKRRKIYFLENVKFHFDTIEGLGTFIEVEALDANGEVELDALKKQCEYYQDFFGVTPSDIVPQSYSDLILEMI